MKKNLNKAFAYLKIGFLVVGVFYAIIFIFAQQFKPKTNSNVSQVDMLEVYREQTYKELYAKGKTSEEEMSKQVYRGTMCFFTGEACTKNPKDADKDFQKSIMGMLTHVSTYPYVNKPVSGVTWASESLQKAGIVPQTYAQGIGFGGLLPIAGIWQIFRNISYLILVLFIVALGFMIMLRTKINPQTVVSVENALPRIVIALLVITFSLPIAGFLIDVMYVIMGLGVSAIVNQIPLSDAVKMGLTSNLYNDNAKSLFDAVFWNGNIWKTGPAIIQMVPLVMQWTVRVLLGVGAFILFTQTPVTKNISDIAKGVPFIEGLLKVAIENTLGAIVTSIVFATLYPLIISAIVYLTALFIFFRILFMLISTYVQILLLIIFSPIMLLFEAIPGQNAFAGWIKNLFALLLTFPIVAIMFTISAVITSQVTLLGSFTGGTGEFVSNGDIWRPPFIYAQDSSGFVVLIGISILFIIPDMVKFIKEAMGVKGLPFTIGPGTLLAGGAVAVGGLFGMIGQVSAFQTAWSGHGTHGLSGILGGVFKGLAPKADVPGTSHK